MVEASSPVDYLALQHLVTVERLGSYFQESGGDVRDAFALYEWNIEASAAAVSLAATVEVILRNALDRQMREWARARGLGEWLDAAPLDPKGRQDVQKARERAGRGGGQVTHGHVVAELSLGFWRYLISRRYLTSLWIPALRHAFPGAPGSAREQQRALEGQVQQLLYLRNRAAHHEPIHRRDLLSDLERAENLVSCIHPVAGSWLRHLERVTEVVSVKPHHAEG